MYQVAAIFPSTDQVVEVRQLLPASIEVISMTHVDAGIEVVFRLPDYGTGLGQQVDPELYESLLNQIRQHSGKVVSDGPRLWDQPLSAADMIDAINAKHHAV